MRPVKRVPDFFKSQIHLPESKTFREIFSGKSRIFPEKQGKIGLRKKFRKKEKVEDSKMNQNKKQNQSYENTHKETVSENQKTQKSEEDKNC